MYAYAMSSANKDESKFSSCLHVRKFRFGFVDRAKPASSENRRFCELALRGRTAGERRKKPHMHTAGQGYRGGKYGSWHSIINGRRTGALSVWHACHERRHREGSGRKTQKDSGDVHHKPLHRYFGGIYLYGTDSIFFGLHCDGSQLCKRRAYDTVPGGGRDLRFQYRNNGNSTFSIF